MFATNTRKKMFATIFIFQFKKTSVERYEAKIYII